MFKKGVLMFRHGENFQRKQYDVSFTSKNRNMYEAGIVNGSGGQWEHEGSLF